MTVSEFVFGHWSVFSKTTKLRGEIELNAKKCNELLISCCESLSTSYSLQSPILGHSGVTLLWLPPEVVGTVVHDGVVVVVEVSRGLVVILEVEVAVLAPPHVLVDDLDVLVAVAARVLVVEAERVHDLVHGAPRRAEARAVPRARPLQGQLLPLVLAPDVGPATGKWI